MFELVFVSLYLLAALGFYWLFMGWAEENNHGRPVGFGLTAVVIIASLEAPTLIVQALSSLLKGMMWFVFM